MILAACALGAFGCKGGERDPATPMDRAAHCPERPELTCATDIGGVFPMLETGTTELGGDDGFTDAACASGGGAGVPDVAYRWTAPWAGRFRVTTEGSTYDTVLSMRDGSCGRELLCNDDIVTGRELQSELVVDLDECQTVTFVIDGFGGSDVGDYTLRIEGIEMACGDGEDDDLDGAVDCEDDDCFGTSIDCTDPMDDWPIPWATAEVGVLEETNRYREMGYTCGPYEGEPAREYDPAPPLTMHPQLRTSARLHSQDMANQDYFDHTSLDGRSLTDRTSAAGYSGGFVGENIALGQPTAEAVVEAWMESPGHCRNIMNPNFRYLGVGRADNAMSTPYWTQNFGDRE